MELAFETKPLRRLCEEEIYAINELGPSVSEKLKHRLADLRAASTIGELIAGNPRIVESKNLSQMKVDLCNGYYILFCANHVNNPMTEIQTIDWSRIKRIKIIRIECNNDLYT